MINQLCSMNVKIKKSIYLSLLLISILVAQIISPVFKALAASTVPSSIVFNEGDKIIRPNSTLSGSVIDPDGVSLLTVEITSSSSSIAIPASLTPVTSDSYNWTAYLNKNALAISLVDPTVNITVKAIDSSSPSDLTSIAFGPYKYFVSDAEIFQEVAETLAGLPPSECSVSEALNSSTPATVFGPQNSAFAGLPAEELAQLLANPDQLCMVVANHIHSGSAIESTTIVTPTQISSVNSTTPPLNIDPVSPGIITVNEAQVVAPDFESVEGILHIVSEIIKPISDEVNISEINTNQTSPEIRGSVKNSNAKVIVRINGVLYLANNIGDGSWVIPSGVVSLDPKNEKTLFTVASYSNPTNPLEVPILLGITMRNDVLNYADVKASIESTVDTGVQILSAVATTLTDSKPLSDDYPSQTNPASSGTSSSSTEPENQELETNDKNQENPAKQNSQWYWWVIGLATLGALYYVLGGSTQAPNAPKKSDK